MKKRLFIPLLLAAAATAMAIMAFSPVETYEAWTPFYMMRSDLETSVRLERAPREMTEPGKVYVYGDRIFVNEKYKGIHIIDNSNPSAPAKVGYIVAPGCLDMAIKNNIIYIDNAVDFVALDLASGKETARLKNYFPERPSPDGYYDSKSGRPEGLVLVGWIQNEKK